MEDTNPFAKASRGAPPSRQPSFPVSSPSSSSSPASRNTSSSLGEDDNRFTVLVERYRSEQEKNKGLRATAEETSRVVEELSAKYKAASEDAERSKFNHETLLKKCRALQLQLKEEREQKAASSVNKIVLFLF
jgi:predicted transcriptional regulator